MSPEFVRRNILLILNNPRQVRDFAKGIGKNAKTDAIDAQVIARFGEVVRPAPQVAQSDDEIKLAALVQRRRQLLDLMNQEQKIFYQRWLANGKPKKVALTANPSNTRVMPQNIQQYWDADPCERLVAMNKKQNGIQNLFCIRS